MAKTWTLRFTAGAEEDLTYLKRRHRNVRQAFRNRVSLKLASDPQQGEELERELAGLRCVHFWNDKYRVAYLLDETEPDSPKVVVIAVGLKDGFYDTVEERMRDARGEAEEK